ncbi:ankyrin repeat domain-containing protein 17-like isoform X1 [Salvia divinorum]|uniref:Ankyrin repeat domain-containing protein 17-like isoform X1 n=1 Tax=Salvia divinorum TaxID=28513 RepID=A0ABD1IJ37_SALDI
MDSTSDIIGALIIEAGASADIKKLREIRRKVGDETEFRKICDLYMDFSTGRNVLHHAARMGHLNICQFLVQNVQVYIDASTHKGDTPLIEATKEGHYEVVEYLILQGAVIGACNSKGSTPLHYALLKGYRTIAALLMLRGAPLNADSVDGTPLQIAIYVQNVSAVTFLLARHAKPNFCCMVLESPLVFAIKVQSLEYLKLLLKAKADPNIFFPGFCPLSYAVREGDIKFLESLLDAGANPNTPNIGDVTAIEEAALARNLQGVEILFPLSKPIESYPKWSVDGIMEYCHSEEAKTEREAYKNRCLVAIGRIGDRAMSFKRYNIAALHFKIANHLDPTNNPKWASKQGLCNAQANRRALALYDVEECLRIEQRLPGPHPGDADAAAWVSKNFFGATYAFMLYPLDLSLFAGFRLSVFEYFAWLYLWSSPEEIMNCHRKLLQLVHK